MSRLGELVRQFRSEPATLAPDPGYGEANAADSEIVRLRLRRPIVAGMTVVLVLVVGLIAWAAISSISGAVVAIGTVKVENNTKAVKHREGGVVRQIFVREGQLVRRGQVLMRLDPVQSQANVDVWQAQYDSALSDSARWQAELANAPDVRFPAELIARQSDPRVAALIAGQRSLFFNRSILYRSQATVLNGQAQQMQAQIQGMRAQISSVDAQSGTINDELRGVRELNALGYAPKTRVLSLERGTAQLKGQRGSLAADVARVQQAIGDLRIQVAQLDDKRQTEAAEGLRMAQDKMTEAAPKLRATAQMLASTVVRAPVDGHVFNLTQFTEGGVAQPGEPLMEIVPTGTPLIISARVKPNDITSVHTGMPARITLTAYSSRTTPPVDGVVTLVGADAATDPQTRETYYQVQIKVDPAELAHIGDGIHLTPGMSAMVNIVTGDRTITDSMRIALREK